MARDRWSRLPEDIIFDIIPTRLPAEAIQRCRWVCKSWRSFITKNHGNLIPDTTKSSVFMSFKGSQLHLYSYNGSSEGLIESKKQELAQCWHGSRRSFVGYSDGLACFVERACLSLNLVFRIVLWNPYLNKFKIIKSGTVDVLREIVLGFGFVNEINDYRVVLLDYNRNDHTSPKFHVYSLLSDSWRQKSIGSSDNCLLRGKNLAKTPSVFVKGRAHWLIWGVITGGVILCFDMIEENFHEINIPLLKGVRRVICAKSFNDSLALFAYVTEMDLLDVLVMKDYGDADSWSRCYRIKCSPFSTAFELIDNGKILIMTVEGGQVEKFVYCDPTTSKNKELQICSQCS